MSALNFFLQPRWGFGGNGLETDGVRDVWARVSSFLYT